MGAIKDAARLFPNEQREPDKEARPCAMTVDDAWLDNLDDLPDGMDGMWDLRQAPVVRVVVNMIRWQLPVRLTVFICADEEVLDVRVFRMVEKGADVDGDAALNVFADVQHLHHAHRLPAVYRASAGLDSVLQTKR